jgi:pimeloyl-ACP methyl ester carboxylesterase
MTSAKPVIALIPGAWHAPDSFSPLTKYLESHDYTVHGIHHTSVNSTPPKKDMSDDVAHVRSSITKLADEGHNVVVVMHSYGGVPGSSAAEGLLASQRSKEGKMGGITHMVYCTAFALPQGVSLMNALHDNPLPWWQFPSDDHKTRHKELRETFEITPINPKQVFYNQMKDDSEVTTLMSGLGKHSYGPL